MFFSIFKNKVVDNPIINLMDNIEKERKCYQELIDFYKNQVDLEKKKSDAIYNKIPYIEFILDNRETGWCWMEIIDMYQELKVGSEIILMKSEIEQKSFIVDRFNEFINNEKGCYMSFYVVENKKNEKKV